MKNLLPKIRVTLFLPCMLLLLLLGSSLRVSAQDIIYRDTFKQSVAATSAQITRWNNFIASLLSSYTYTGMTISGTNDVTGKTCTDATITKDMANALRTTTTYISSTTGGNVWSVCNRYLGEVWINPPSSCSGSNCPNPGYIIRPGIGTSNSNWGGINTATCGGTDQWMELKFMRVPPFNKEIGTTNIPGLDLCTYTQDIKATFKNFGKKALDSFNYYVQVQSTTYGPFKAKFKLLSQKDTTFTVRASQTFSANTAYTLRVWTTKPDNFNDSFTKNDTFTSKFTFFGSSGIPNAIDTLVCGSQSVLLRAVPSLSSDSLAWFTDKQLTKQVGLGKYYKTPFLPSGKKYKFYVSSYTGFVKGSLALGYTLTNGWPSSMFDIKAVAGSVTVDSIGLNIYGVNFAAGTPLDVEVYLREGSFNDAGATTTSSMWTKIGTPTVICRGSQVKSTLNISFDLKAGKNYAVYVNPTQNGSNTILAKPAGSTISNAEISLTGGTLSQLNFSNPLTGYTIDGEIFYKKVLCRSAPDSATLDIRPSPYGGSLAETPGFQKATLSGGSGVKAAPHVVAMDDTLVYTLNAPTGYSNSGHNTTWKIKNVSMKTSTGRPITTFTWSDPNSPATNDPGKLTYWPASTEIDSFVSATVSFQDLGPNFCDTMVTTYIYVAPLPVPKFSRSAKICDGDVVEFINLSTIESGFINYKWYFGDGDSSEAAEPVHAYPAFGTYYVKLIAYSSKYGYAREMLDTIIVTQIPKVAFKVNNVCEGQTHAFTNQTTVSAGTLSYNWKFGVGAASSTATNPTYKYVTAGKYTVTLSATANGCVATLSKNAYLFAKPNAAFTIPGNVGVKFCTNNTVPFMNNSTISSGVLGQLWDFGDGDEGTVFNPTHNYKTGGNYSVILYAISEFGCRDTASKTVDVFEAPKVSFTHSQVCDLTPTSFTNTTPAVMGAVANYAWSFGDGNTSTTKSPVHQYSALGPRTVKLIVTLDNGCKDEIVQNVVVRTQADAKFEALDACAGTPVHFDNKTTFKQGTITYKWYFGNGDSSEDADPVYTFSPTTTNTYNVVMKAVVDGQCASSATKQVTIYELPKSTFTIANDWTLAKDGYRTVLVTANNLNYPFYRYKFSDGGSLDQHTGKYQFPYEGDFSVTLYVRNDVGCETSTTQAKSIQGSLGTDNLEGGNLKIYPNPSTGVVNISATTRIQNIEVFNVLGEKVEMGKQINDKNAVLNFNGNSSGVYLITVTTGEGASTRRITISK